jgi:predicted FMN-binding regulatory protein PaiB
MPITRIDGKRKMSQNRSAEDRAGVIDGLAASDDPMDRAVADSHSDVTAKWRLALQHHSSVLAH